MDITPELFEELVDRALELIPEELLARVENCVVVVEDAPDPEDGDLLGYYDGVPLSERGSWYSGVLPDRIVIFRDPILALCETAEDVVDEVRITVWHEIAHYFGIDDDELDTLGYA